MEIMERSSSTRPCLAARRMAQTEAAAGLVLKRLDLSVGSLNQSQLLGKS